MVRFHLLTSVPDPNCLNTDPYRIPDPTFSGITDPDSGI